MATIDFLPFGTDLGANVVSQPDYVAAVWRGIGFFAGIAQPDQANKTWRQTAFMTAAIATYLSRQNGDVDVLDNGDLEAMITLLTSGISIGASVRPARLVTASTPLVLAASDYAIGLNRTAGLGAMTAALPADAQVGQSFVIEDLRGNLAAFPCTVSPPSGTISNAATFVMNEDKQSAEFRLYAAGVWSIRT